MSTTTKIFFDNKILRSVEMIEIRRESKPEDKIWEKRTPYDQLKDIVASYGYGTFGGAAHGNLTGSTAAKRDIYVAALDEYRGREADFTDADLMRVIDAAGRA